MKRTLIKNTKRNVSGLIGDVDTCEITNDDRKKGVNITDLIAEEK